VPLGADYGIRTTYSQGGEIIAVVRVNRCLPKRDSSGLPKRDSSELIDPCLPKRDSSELIDPRHSRD